MILLWWRCNFLYAMQRLVIELFLCLGVYCVCNAERSFGIDYDNNTFVRDGEAFRYISGSIHYTRVPYQYWDDRLHKMAAAGLNAIQIYVPWNAHEAVQGVYDFKGQCDIVQFLKTAQKYNLAVILRPGPYICAEWEFGGLPAWLLKYPNMQVRTSDPNYVNNVKKWFTVLYAEISPMLYKNGGPIITIQIENEYGSYPACDYEYLTTLKNLTQSLVGDDVVLFSTDGDGDAYLKCGTIPDVYATVDFGITYTPEKNFAIQRHKEPKGPLVNSEFYTGWLDHWGQNHSTVPTAAVAKSLDLQLALGANVNMYMFEGGTNFGYWNGANYPYHPVPTSYDYDGPLTEAGDITDKYMQIRTVATKYNGDPKMRIPPSTPKAAYGRLNLTYSKNLIDYVISTDPGKSSVYPLTMEDIDHYYGFILYEHTLTDDVTGATLNLPGVRDRANVMIGTQYDQKSFGVVDRIDNNQTVQITGAKGDNLYILVENMGRINYGGQMNDNLKGLISNVTMNGNILTQWKQYKVLTAENKLGKYMSKQLRRSGNSRSGRRLDNSGSGRRLENSGSSRRLDNSGSSRRLDNSGSVRPKAPVTSPSIVAGALLISDEPQDTYLDMSMWTKGVAFINGVNIGRYWPHKGPQVRLYVPKYVLRKGQNAISLIEVERSLCADSPCYINFYDTPLINATVPTNKDGKTFYTEKMNYKGNIRQLPPIIHSNSKVQKPTSLFQTIYNLLMVLVDSKWGILLL